MCLQVSNFATSADTTVTLTQYALTPWVDSNVNVLQALLEMAEVVKVRAKLVPGGGGGGGASEKPPHTTIKVHSTN